MKQYKIITLVDVTRTQPARSETDKLKLGQQANFNSLIQAIGMRSNVEWASDPKVFEGRLPNGVEGKARHWIWIFLCERDEIFLKGDDPVGLLKEDLHGVPVLNTLNNTAEIEPSCFFTKGDKVNTWIYEYNEIE